MPGLHRDREIVGLVIHHLRPGADRSSAASYLSGRHTEVEHGSVRRRGIDGHTVLGVASRLSVTFSMIGHASCARIRRSQAASGRPRHNEVARSARAMALPWKLDRDRRNGSSTIKMHCHSPRLPCFASAIGSHKRLGAELRDLMLRRVDAPPRRSRDPWGKSCRG